MKSISYSVVVLSGAILAQESMTTQQVARDIFLVNDESEAEALAAQCYPMPWLESLLNDETVPEEDRYWLDCRVRAFIATESHTFFGEEGNPFEIDAEWIQPAEDYWRSTFIVSSGEEEIVAYPTQAEGYLTGRPGNLVDRFGERFGEIALAARGFSGSVESSTFASAMCRISGEYHLVIQHSDGQYIVPRFTMGLGLLSVSRSGEFIILAARKFAPEHSSESESNRAILLRRNGGVQWENSLEMIPIGNRLPAISPDDQFCCVATQAEDIWNAEVRRMVQVFSIETGNELWRVENPSGTRISFSPDGRILFLSGSAGDVRFFEVESGDELWSDGQIQSVLDYSSIRSLTGCNNARLLTALLFPKDRYATPYLVLLDRNGNILAVDEFAGRMDVSPCGAFCISESAGNYNDGGALFIVRRIEDGI